MNYFKTLNSKFIALLAITFILALTQVNSFGQDKNRVTGTVFHDVNANPEPCVVKQLHLAHKNQ
jgi:hypothetical protein